MRLIITRHGKTEENKLGILQGQSIPGELTEKGIETTWRLATWLEQESISTIYSSDLKRAADTAKIIATKQPNAKLILTKDLRERNLGEYEGVKKSSLNVDPSILIGLSLDPKEGESLDELHHRVKTFLDEIKEKHRDDTVLIVGHHAVNTVLLSILTNISIEEIEQQHNTAINIFTITGETTRTEVWDSTEHLHN